jgi:hypothetical protein
MIKKINPLAPYRGLLVVRIRQQDFEKNFHILLIKS